MRQMAIAVAAMLVLAIISPAFAQPFADTPTNHWAYDAIAELAAKGLVEGYPDGTFKGDRAMTRYEMAMVVARLLARIESIQIPTPPPPPAPEVTKADIDMILRLVNEFRAELAAKNVRLTAVEEELNAIKAKLDNVRITGGFRFRYDLNQLENKTAGPLPGNGNPGTGAISAGTTNRGNRPRYEFKLGFDGSVAPDIHLILGLESAQGYQFFNSSNYGFGLGQNGQPAQGAFASIDSFFLDWKPSWAGGTTELWLGRFGNDTPCGGGCYPLQFGPFGLLLNNNGDTWEDTTFDSGNNFADGIRLALHFASLADLQIQGVFIRIAGNIGSLSYPSGEDMYGADANIQIIQGLRLGAYYVGNSISNAGGTPSTSPSPFGNLFHLYGPGGGSLNPATARCPAAAGGINCPAAGNGWGAYLSWDAFPGIHLDVEAAQWNDQVFGGTDSGAQVAASANLSTMLNICCNIVFSAGYEYFGPNFYPPYGGAEADLSGDYWDVLYPGNAQGFYANASVSPWQGITVYGNWLTGNNVSNSQPFNSWVVGISYGFAPNAKITLKYRDLSMQGIEQQNVYRAQVDYSF
jgi:S-layer homology domain